MLYFLRRSWTYCDLTLRILRYAYKAEWAYKKSFIIQSVAMLINDVLLLFIWVFFFAKFEEVNGWTFEDTQLLFAIHIHTFVFTLLFFGGVIKIAEKIGEGDLDHFLVQPRSVLWRCLVNGFSISILGDLGFAIGMLIFVAFTQGWVYLIVIPLVGALAAWGLLMINIAFQSLGFWFKRFERAAWHYFWAVESPGLYPQTAIIGGLRIFLLTVVPSVWIITFPFTLVQDKAWEYLALIVGFNVVITLIATSMFRAGLKRYESGNLVRVNN